MPTFNATEEQPKVVVPLEVPAGREVLRLAFTVTPPEKIPKERVTLLQVRLAKSTGAAKNWYVFGLTVSANGRLLLERSGRGPRNNVGWEPLRGPMLYPGTMHELALTWSRATRRLVLGNHQYETYFETETELTGSVLDLQLGTDHGGDDKPPIGWEIAWGANGVQWMGEGREEPAAEQPVDEAPSGLDADLMGIEASLLTAKSTVDAALARVRRMLEERRP